VEKLFFNKGLISGLILLGQGEKHFFLEKMLGVFYTNIFLDKNNCLPKISCHNSEPSKHYMGSEFGRFLPQ
jgi:hypothetical protein